jgi:hypothetical protein
MNTVTVSPFHFTTDRAVMVGNSSPVPITDWDRQMFDLVPTDHFLRKATAEIPWDNFFDKLAPFYSEKKGRPSKSPS